MGDDIYSTNSAKNLFVRNRDLQAVCEREKRLLEWEWQTSHLELKKETARFKKKAENLYLRTQDIEVDPKNRRVNLALELKLKTLGQSKFMPPQTGPVGEPGRAQTSLGAANGVPTTPMPNVDSLRSRSAAEFASHTQPNMAEKSNMADLQVPLQHPLLRKRKAELFARPPPRKWLEARWKAILKKNTKQKMQLDVMVEEFIQEIEEYKERFRRMCNGELYPAKQTILNRRVSLRMPLLLGGGAVKQAQQAPDISPPITQSNSKTKQVHSQPSKVALSPHVVPKITVTFDHSATPPETSHIQLPDVQDSTQQKTQSRRPKAQKSPARLEIPSSSMLEVPSSSMLQTPAAGRKDSLTHFPKVSSRRATLASNSTEQKYLTLLESDNSSQDDSDNDDEEPKFRHRFKPPFHYNENKTALTLDTEQLVNAFEEFNKGDKSVESMRKMGALASRLKVKVTKARDKSYVPFVGTHKAIKAFKGLLTQSKSKQDPDADP